MTGHEGRLFETGQAPIRVADGPADLHFPIDSYEVADARRPSANASR